MTPGSDAESTAKRIIAKKDGVDNPLLEKTAAKGNLIALFDNAKRIFDSLQTYMQQNGGQDSVKGLLANTQELIGLLKQEKWTPEDIKRIEKDIITAERTQVAPFDQPHSVEGGMIQDAIAEARNALGMNPEKPGKGRR